MPLGARLPGWLTPAVADAMLAAMRNCQAAGGDAEAACAAGAAVAWGQYPALPRSHLIDAAHDLLSTI